MGFILRDLAALAILNASSRPLAKGVAPPPGSELNFFLAVTKDFVGNSKGSAFNQLKEKRATLSRFA